MIEPSVVAPIPEDPLSWARAFTEWHGFRADYAEQLLSCRQLLREANLNRAASERLNQGVAAAGFRIAEEHYEGKVIELTAAMTTCDAYISVLARVISLRKMPLTERIEVQNMLTDLRAFVYGITRLREANDALEREVRGAEGEKASETAKLRGELALARKKLEDQQQLIDKLVRNNGNQV